MTYPSEIKTTEFDLGYDLGGVLIPFFNTRILPTQSGYEKRIGEWVDPLLKYSIGSRKYTSTELNYLLNLFHSARGKAIKFTFTDRSRNKKYLLRFDVDSIAVQFDAFDITTKEAIYSVSGINLYGEEITENLDVYWAVTPSTIQLYNTLTIEPAFHFVYVHQPSPINPLDLSPYFHYTYLHNPSPIYSL